MRVSTRPRTGSSRRITRQSRARETATESVRQSPHPIAGLLVSRASVNAELNVIMKKVATGSASQGQLRIFQRDVDEVKA